MTKKEKKQEAVRKHNAKYEYLKANPKSNTEIVREALLSVVKSIN